MYGSYTYSVYASYFSVPTFTSCTVILKYFVEGKEKSIHSVKYFSSIHADLSSTNCSMHAHQRGSTYSGACCGATGAAVLGLHALASVENARADGRAAAHNMRIQRHDGQDGDKNGGYTVAPPLQPSRHFVQYGWV